MVRIGIIGVGGIATGVHIPGILEAKNGKVTAICDVNPEALKKAGEKLNIPEEFRFSNHMDLLNCGNIDAVEICTPNHLHVPFSLDAWRANIPFEVEKPLSINMTEASRLGDALKEKNVPNMMCFSYRFRSAVRYAKELIEKGLLGDIVHVNVEYFKDSAFWKGRPMEWRFEKQYAGTGVLGDLGVHLIDMAQFLVGDMTRVCSRTGIVVKQRPIAGTDKIGNVETDDFCNFMADFENGASGVFSVTRCAIGQSNTIKYGIYGTLGMMEFNLNNPDEISVCIGEIDVETHGQHTIKVPKKYRASQEQTFIDMVEGKDCPDLPTVEDGLKCQKILDALLESSEKNCWIDLK